MCIRDRNKEGAAVLAGINMEGPFICSKKKGAQAATHIHKPDVAIDVYKRQMMM